MNFSHVDLTQTFCGSPEYMAPEMLRQDGHGFALDYYQLGALLFEMLTGLPPHYNQNRMKMYQNIMNQETLEFPKNLSREAIDLMKRLLDKNSISRLSDPQSIRDHPFFTSLNWDQIVKRDIDPPIQVDFQRSNFDSDYTSLKITLKPEEEDYDLSELEQLQSNTKRLNRKKTRSMTHLTSQHHFDTQGDELDTFERACEEEDHREFNNMTPNFQDFIYPGKPQKRERSDSQNNAQQLFGGQKIKTSKKCRPPQCLEDNLIVESILEGETDDVNTSPRLKLIEENHVIET